MAQKCGRKAFSVRSECTKQGNGTTSATEEKGRLAQEKAVLRRTVGTGYVNEMSQNSGKHPDNAG